MRRVGTIAFLLTCNSAHCLAEIYTTKKLQKPSASVESMELSPQTSLPSIQPTQKISIRASYKISPMPSALKVIEIYWTRGLENERVLGGKVDHYVDLNVVVRAADFTPGECVEAIIRAEDNSEVAENIKKIVLRGNVNEEGIAYFNPPLKGYTINVLSND